MYSYIISLFLYISIYIDVVHTLKILMDKECGNNLINTDWDMNLGTLFHNTVRQGYQYITGDYSDSLHGNRLFNHISDPGKRKMECERYFNRMLSKKYMHLANIGNDGDSMYEIAQLLTSNEYPFDMDNHSDKSTALRLYIYNAMKGDIPSLVTLGWAFHSGNIPGNVLSSDNSICVCANIVMNIYIYMYRYSS